MVHAVAWLRAAAARAARPWHRRAASQLVIHRGNAPCTCTSQLLTASVSSRQRRCLLEVRSSLRTHYMISARDYMPLLGSQRQQRVLHSLGTALPHPCALAIVGSRRARVPVSFSRLHPQPSTAPSTEARPSLRTQHMVSGRYCTLRLGSERQQLVLHAPGTALLRPSSLAIVRTRHARVRVSFSPPPSAAVDGAFNGGSAISPHATHDLRSMLHAVAWLTAAAARPARPWHRRAASQLVSHRGHTPCTCTSQLLTASIHSRQRRLQRRLGHLSARNT